MTTSARLRKAAHNRLMAKRYPPHKRPARLLPRHRTALSTLCRCKAVAAKGCNCTRSVSVPLIIPAPLTRSDLTCGPCQKGRHS